MCEFYSPANCTQPLLIFISYQQFLPLSYLDKSISTIVATIAKEIYSVHQPPAKLHPSLIQTNVHSITLLKHTANHIRHMRTIVKHTADEIGFYSLYDGFGLLYSFYFRQYTFGTLPFHYYKIPAMTFTQASLLLIRQIGIDS